jgi:hypothetical protein
MPSVRISMVALLYTTLKVRTKRRLKFASRARVAGHLDNGRLIRRPGKSGSLYDHAPRACPQRRLLGPASRRQNALGDRARRSRRLKPLLNDFPHRRNADERLIRARHENRLERTRRAQEHHCYVPAASLERPQKALERLWICDRIGPVRKGLYVAGVARFNRLRPICVLERFVDRDGNKNRYIFSCIG